MEQVHLEQDGFLVRTMWQQLRMLYIVKRMVDILLLLFFIPGLITGSIVGASYKATIAVLPATYQSERDETKDYAFLSLNYNYLLKYQI